MLPGRAPGGNGNPSSWLDRVPGCPEVVEDHYEDLRLSLAGLLAGESNWIANCANLSALIYHSLDRLNWAGVYLVDEGGLVLGPFQGKPACVRIPMGKGVCGTAAQLLASQRVADVHDFPGHIACDSASRSELVIPLIIAGELRGVLDLDSPEVDRFSNRDQRQLEQLVALFCAHHESVAMP